jgi:hypothetical protein
VQAWYLRQLAANQLNLHEALRGDHPPAEVLALVDTLAALLRPGSREQIKSPADIAALLMVEMAHLDREELRMQPTMMRQQPQGGCMAASSWIEKARMVIRRARATETQSPSAPAGASESYTAQYRT